MKTFFSSNTNSKLQVKICGLKNLEEAQIAIRAGADALGFNFYPLSKRFIPPEVALSLIPKLPRRVACIAVVVNPTVAKLEFLLASRVFDAIQFHGDESPEFCQNSGFPFWIKAIRTCNYEFAQKQVLSFSSPYLLLDSSSPNGAYGGTGTLIDFFVAARIIRTFSHKHFLLAGGLRKENVRAAVAVAHPFAVDVASGVEDVGGQKTAEYVQAFIYAAQAV